MDNSQERICKFLTQNKLKFISEDQVAKKFAYKNILTFYIGKEGWSAYGIDGRDFKGRNHQTSKVGFLITEYKDSENGVY